MPTLTKLSYAILACLLAAIVLLLLQQPLWAAVLATLATLANMREVISFSDDYRLGMAVALGFALGFALDVANHTLAFLVLPIVLINMAPLVRIALYGNMGFTRMLWLPPLLYGMGLVGFVAQAWLAGTRWEVWLIPVPVIVARGITTFQPSIEGAAMRRAVKRGFEIGFGDEVPHFTLPDQDGRPVNIAEYRGHQNVLLTFVRGDWCPFCHRMLKAYEARLSDFERRQTVVLAISPDPVAINKAMAERLNLHFPILTDADGTVTKLFGIRAPMVPLGASAHAHEKGIPLPMVFLLDKEGRMRYSNKPGEVGHLPKADELLALTGSV
jgi:peroxiredoxin